MSADTRFDATVTTSPSVLCNTPAVIGTSFNPQYVLDEVELVLQKIVMPPGYVSTMMKSMKEAGMIRYDFNAMQTYKYSMLAQDREGTVTLPLHVLPRADEFGPEDLGFVEDQHQLVGRKLTEGPKDVVRVCSLVAVVMRACVQSSEPKVGCVLCTVDCRGETIRGAC